MRRSPLLEAAHAALQNYDRQKVDSLLGSVNLTLQEKEVITKSELDGTDIETICNSFEHWNKKMVISYAQLVRIKKLGMEKIGQYLSNS